MEKSYGYNITNPKFDNLGYVKAVANLKDKHDRSAPSNFHWKILKCRMIIFSNSTILASPDKNDVKEVHIIFNKVGDDFDKLISLFIKFSLTQEGGIRKVTPEIFQTCFQYTMTAKLAPLWNTIGHEYLINNREFLAAKDPQDGLRYNVSSKEEVTAIELKPVKIHVKRSDEDFRPGEWIRVLPSLFKATVVDCHESLPQIGSFKSYKDLRRHWKNIHGYRLPDEEAGPYCTVQFWRGEPLTYPKLCVVRNFPIITPVPKNVEKIVLAKFISCLKNKMSHMLGIPLTIVQQYQEEGLTLPQIANERFNETQAVSLCTPTQYSHSNR